MSVIQKENAGQTENVQRLNTRNASTLGGTAKINPWLTPAYKQITERKCEPFTNTRSWERMLKHTA